MKLLYPLLFADAPLTDPEGLSRPAPSVQSDPLIDKGGEITIYIGLAVLIIAAAAVVGAFSRRVEHAIVTALVLSLFPIVFFVFLRH